MSETKKIPREVELKAAIVGAQNSARQAVEKLRDEMQIALRKITSEMLNKVGDCKRAFDSEMVKVRMMRDNAYKQAEHERTKALREAQGAYDKSMKAASSTHDELQKTFSDELDAAVSKVRENYQPKMTELETLMSARMAAITESLDQTIALFRTELDGLEAASAAKTVTTQVPDAPAPAQETAAEPEAPKPTKKSKAKKLKAKVEATDG
jgi:hypothetical protein